MDDAKRTQRLFVSVRSYLLHHIKELLLGEPWKHGSMSKSSRTICELKPLSLSRMYGFCKPRCLLGSATFFPTRPPFAAIQPACAHPRCSRLEAEDVPMQTPAVSRAFFTVICWQEKTLLRSGVSEGEEDEGSNQRTQTMYTSRIQIVQEVIDDIVTMSRSHLLPLLSRSREPWRYRE
ncbi:hypothetical protein NUW54_g14040 [Trametes sanguinea]|uniref:Uncharacterized protein n=1 Tax=Trametes sanguinea TaxID=158606 RepID=A0ACC1MG72_9APHY|nr:hypothetical protein NUW54_g14040 [Trametes sanguinea]